MEFRIEVGLKRHRYRTVTNMSIKGAQMSTYTVLERINLKRHVGFIFRSVPRRGDIVEVDHRRVSKVISRLRRSKRARFEYIHLMATHGPFKHQDARRRYRDALKTVDTQLGRVVDFLDTSGRLEKTILIFCGDHGEGLGEHGMFAHAQALYAEQIAVPLIMFVPGRKPKVLKHPITINAIPELVMNALGGTWPYAVSRVAEGQMRGLNREFAVQEMIMADELLWRSIQRPPFVYHHKYLEEREELYNTSIDPGELDDLSARTPQKLDMFRRLESTVDGWERDLTRQISE